MKTKAKRDLKIYTESVIASIGYTSNQLPLHPIRISNRQWKELQSQCKALYGFLKKIKEVPRLLTARPEFIWHDDQFKLIDLNVSCSIMPYSVPKLLKYFSAHPVSSIKLSHEDIALFHFESSLTKKYKLEVFAKTKFPKVLILSEPFNDISCVDPEQIHRVHSLVEHGISADLINPRFAKFKFLPDRVICNGKIYSHVMFNFLEKYIVNEPWLFTLFKKVEKSKSLLHSSLINIELMNKLNLITWHKKQGNLQDVMTIDEYLNLLSHNSNSGKRRISKSFLLKGTHGNNSEEIIWPSKNVHTWRNILTKIPNKDGWILQKIYHQRANWIWTMENEKVRRVQFNLVFSPFMINEQMAGVLVKCYQNPSQLNNGGMMPNIALPEEINEIET